jgi:hypothetical protein
MPQGTGKSGNGIGGERQVIDFNEMRAQKLEEKRRKTERIFFKHLLSVYTVVGNGKQMAPIEIIDISEEGLAFQVPFNPDKPWPTQTTEIPLRLYFSQDTFLEVIAKVANSRPSIENGARFTRFGCQVDQATKSYPAYQQFVKFMKLYSEHAHKDMGDISVFYL